ELARPETIDLALAQARGAIVADLAPPIDGRGTGEAALAAACARAGVRRIVYVSSTGVYAPAGGAWVDEAFPLAPITASGRARVAAEEALAGGPVPCVRLRAAGIHGPGRGVLARLATGTYRLVGDGATYVSRIHVDDLVACVLAAGDAHAPGPVYNVADDEPCTARELALDACLRLGLPPPPSVALADVDPEVAGMLTADRRIDARRIKDELGVAWRHPTWRTSLP
ncbi:MAG TPA: NAD-dependent epimerase/dehydratase family protein, partial [Kofleriaceae bacterium]|nr:NAD-dependent epimerase/dehydratase family protein [Kofleriaceae bacterium]